jgi:signal recognition particle subunit SRP68
MAAERAWSYAMELKRDAGDEPPKRAHMIRRLKKATIHAAELVAGFPLFPCAVFV